MITKEVNHHEKIEEYCAILKQYVKQLDTHINSVLQKHEQDFLNAFKCEMFNLYSQLKDLKKKNDENELKLKRDEQINKLQMSLEWFREEAVKLGESTQFYKKEAEKWKAKAESLEDDRKFLESQLKLMKKKIKMLQIDKDCDKVYDESLKSSIFKTQDITNMKFAPSSKNGEILLELVVKSSYHIEDFLFAAEKVFNDKERKFMESIKHLTNSLETERKRSKVISAQQNSLFFVKSDLETIFLDCVEEVRKEISKRKTQTLANQKFKRLSVTQKAEKNNMTSQDKKKILELLISNEQVLVMLYEKLFPYRASYFGTGEKQVEDYGKAEEMLNLEELLKQVSSKPNTAKPLLRPHRGKSVS